MSRMHSRAKGKSGSTKPAAPTKPSWVALKPKEIEMLVVKYAKEGKGASKIGLYLRDEYGVPGVKLMTGKSVQQILVEKKALPELPEDLMALMRKLSLIHI